MPGAGSVAYPKPEPRKRIKARRKRQQRKVVADVRAYVFARERGMCRCRHYRPAESMHEIIFRSQGGKVTPENSIAVCGDGVRGCHGRLHRRDITIQVGPLGAEGYLLIQHWKEGHQ